MSEQKNMKAGKPSKKRRAAMRRAQNATRRAQDDKDVSVRGNGNVIHAGNRGDYELFPMLGKLLGPLWDLFSGMFEEEGRGDYKVKKNSLVMTSSPPMITSNVKMDFHRIRHREFIGFVNSSSSSDPNGKSAFENTPYSLNPGQIATYPWLSTIAANYEEYEIMGAIVFYKPTSGSATGANTSLGDVLISTNYNAGDSPYPNAQQMLNAQYASSGAPNVPFAHMIECEPHKNPISELYVRTGAVPSGRDPSIYDLGTMQVATVGQQTLGQQLGELWICYDIQFYKPRLGGLVSGNDIPTDHFLLSGVTGTVPLGTSQISWQGSGAIGGTINGSTGTVYTFPVSVTEGTFLIVYQCQGTAAALTAFTMTLNLSYDVLQQWSTNSAANAKSFASAPSTGGTSGVFVHCQIIRFVASPVLPVTVTYGTAGTLPTAPTLGDLYITQVNSGVSLLSEAEVAREAELEQLLGNPKFLDAVESRLLARFRKERDY